MTKTEAQPVLAEAADILGDQLGVLLKRLVGVLRPHVDRLEERFLARLDQLHYTSLQSRALAQLTAGAAARILAHGADASAFFESVEYHAQRLAKLNVPPAAVASALAEYDKILAPVLRQQQAGESKNFQWVRDQLHFCVMLTLNNAYYHVREAETQAFYEMFWAEVESRRLSDLLGRFLETLARFCRADRARLYLSAGAGAPLELLASYGCEAGSAVSVTKLPKGLGKPRSFYPGKSARGLLLETGWAVDLARCWSVPMISGKRVTGLLQFGFVKPYEWLPREQELLNAASERCLVAAEKARLMEDLSMREAQIRRLAERMMQVEEAERRRISRELHDQSGQDLLWIRLQMEMLENSLAAEQGAQPWKEKLAELRDMTEKTIVEIRRLIGALSPAVLEQLGLVPALRQLINRFRQTHTSRVRLQVGRMQPLPKQLEVIVYRLVQECLNNIGKHSFCSNVQISVNHADGNLRLCVEDDGVGFRVEDALNKPGSFGLAGIRERVALLGGVCEIESRMMNPAGPLAAERRGRVRGAGLRGPKGGKRAAAPPSGTTVRVELPVPSAR